MASRVIRVHFLIPADKAPAPHMTGGIVDLKEPRLGVLGTGIPHVAACDPTIVMDPANLGSSVWWGVACRACAATEAFKTAKATIPNPRESPASQVESMEGCC